MWFIGVEVDKETSAPSPKKIQDPPLLIFTDREIEQPNPYKIKNLSSSGSS